jgi:hypothetical protein
MNVGPIMKKLLWLGAIVSVIFPLAVVLGPAYSSGTIHDPNEHGPIITMLIMAFLPFPQIMLFLFRRRRNTDPVAVNGAAISAFIVFAWNGLLWASVTGGSGPGRGANIGGGMLLMVQWAFTMPALLLWERVGRRLAASDQDKTDEGSDES